MCLTFLKLLYPNSTSSKPADTMGTAPIHCNTAIFSPGSNIDALNIATTTSDIVSIPTRPGNKICDTLKIIKKPGNIITIDQISAVGKAYSNMQNTGSWSPTITPAKNADRAVVHKNMNAVRGKIGILDQQLSTAIPKSQNIPDRRL